MIQRIGRKRYSLFAYDVESHNDDESIAKKETSIWLSSFIDETNKPLESRNFFYSIEDWLNKLEEMTTPRWHNHKRNLPNVMIWIYNLSFEFSFILPKLLERGIKWKEKLDYKNDDHVFSSITNKTCASVWEVTIIFNKGGQVVLKDMSKIFPSGLANVAKSFGLPTQKGEIDYKKNRLHNYHVTDEEKIYNFKDTRIIVDILLIMQKRDDKDFFKSVSAASYSCRKMLKVGYPHAWKPLQVFRKHYPLLEKDESEFLRNNFAGGITYATKKYQFIDIKDRIGHLDIHQAYPNALVHHVYPKGFGEYFKGKPLTSMRLNLCHVLVSYSGVKLHSVIKLIGTDIATDVELWLWDFEIVTMAKCYLDLRVKYIDYYSYHAGWLPWRSYFQQNYDLRMEAKAKGDAFNIMYYKLLNNSSYGKMGEHGHDTTLENIIGDDGIIDSIVHTKENPPLNSTYTYLPIACCCTAYNRCFLVNSALALGYENVVYFDTDSIFYIKNKESLEGSKNLHIGDKLGEWGIENDIIRAQFTAPKRYKLVEENDGADVNVFHLAGVNFSKMEEMPSYDDLNIVSGHYDIQGVMRVKGGTIIVTKAKDLKVQGKYLDIYYKNANISQA